MASVISTNKSFRKHFENGIYLHLVLPTEAKRAIFTNLPYCSPGTDGLNFSSSWDGTKWAMPKGEIKYSWGIYNKVNPSGAYSICRNYVLKLFFNLYISYVKI